jgi:hypothetical protein
LVSGLGRKISSFAVAGSPIKKTAGIAGKVAINDRLPMQESLSLFEQASSEVKDPTLVTDSNGFWKAWHGQLIKLNTTAKFTDIVESFSEIIL